MKKKKLATLIGVLGISLSTTALAACSNNQVNNVKNEKSSKQPAQKSVTTSSKKESNINNDEWMMMGYVAYRAKDSNGSDALNEVESNLNSNDLSATRNSANSYTFSNDYGSVDVKVENDKVVVSNDGTSTFSKDKLEDSFNGDMKTIQKLAKNISTSSNFKSVSESDSETGSWKSGIPAEIVGEYSDENIPRKQEPVDVYSIRPDHLTFWQSGMPTNFASNIQYQKLGKNKYKLRFDMRSVGGPLKEDSPTLSNGEKYQDSTGTLTFEKEDQGSFYRIDGITVEKVSSTKFSLPASPEDL